MKLTKHFSLEEFSHSSTACQKRHKHHRVIKLYNYETNINT